MQYFYAVVHKDEDSAFGVTFPDLPGCFSAADRMEDVLPGACEALELWFEDAAHVTPMRLDQVRAQVATDLAEGAFLIAVPRIRRTGRVVRANISIDRGMLDAIDRVATERNLTRSAFLADAALKEIEGYSRG
ncbi:MAG: type II toxin-antitoxin system HicB family antitoxin [Novosphingobium sp.]|uniref:type II toxin-antitoxin system HicB family antitoxin n=1 Tax=Novosphingobium sp. TaxID=1874826 RepID=UPI0032BE3F63